MNPPDVEERILRCLAAAPHSMRELVHTTCLRVERIAPIVRELVAAGQVVKLETDREGGPFYCLPGDVEACERRDHSDLRLARDYGAQYDGPGWMADV